MTDRDDLCARSVLPSSPGWGGQVRPGAVRQASVMPEGLPSGLNFQVEPSIGNRVRRAVGQFLKLGPVTKRESAWFGMQKAKRTKADFMLEDQRGACVETDERRAGHQGVYLEARVHQGILHDEYLVTEDREVAERKFAGGAVPVDPELGLEDLNVCIQQRDNRGVDVKMPCCFRTKRIKFRYDNGIHEAAGVKHAKAFRFVGSQRKLCHVATRR